MSASVSSMHARMVWLRDMGSTSSVDGWTGRGTRPIGGGQVQRRGVRSGATVVEGYAGGRCAGSGTDGVGPLTRKDTAPDWLYGLGRRGPNSSRDRTAAPRPLHSDSAPNSGR